MHCWELDATWAIWEMSFAFKLKEPTKYILETQTSTSTHILAMNHRTWKKLPNVAKAYLTDNFEKHMLEAGPFWKKPNAHFFKVLRDDPKIEHITWSDAEFAKFDARLAPWLPARPSTGGATSGLPPEPAL